MQTIKLEIEDSKLNIVLNIIQNLKEDVIAKYELVHTENKVEFDFMKLQVDSMKDTWDNKEDEAWDDL